MNHDNIETAESAESEKIEAITSFIVAMSLEGTVSLVDSPLNNLRKPSQADLKMIAWYLNEHLNVNPPPPPPDNTGEALRRRLAKRKEE